MEEIVDLVNNPYVVERIVKDEYPCRVSMISQGIEGASNFITSEQVQMLIKMQNSYEV
ncbi:hypothetical protein KKF17_03565 [Patescibacteria group bacterium]|nr:hypothetical protein [Patescibacteria group bacterium]